MPPKTPGVLVVLSLTHFFYLPVMADKETLNLLILTMQNIPNNKFCPQEVFQASSKIVCASNCFLEKDPQSCLASQFLPNEAKMASKGPMGTCKCGRPMCSGGSSDSGGHLGIMVSEYCQKVEDPGKRFAIALLFDRKVVIFLDNMPYLPQYKLN